MKKITLEQLQDEMNGTVAHYKKAARCLLEYGYYRRGRCNRPQEGTTNHFDLYVLENEEVKQLCHNISYHRFNIILKTWKEKKLNKINPVILENYIHNGYMTRCKGLFGKYTEQEIERMQYIGTSHADYLGHETGNSRLDHENRVRARNNRGW